MLFLGCNSYTGFLHYNCNRLPFKKKKTRKAGILFLGANRLVSGEDPL